MSDLALRRVTRDLWVLDIKGPGQLVYRSYTLTRYQLDLLAELCANASADADASKKKKEGRKTK